MTRSAGGRRGRTDTSLFLASRFLMSDVCRCRKLLSIFHSDPLKEQLPSIYSTITLAHFLNNSPSHTMLVSSSRFSARRAATSFSRRLQSTAAVAKNAPRSSQLAAGAVVAGALTVAVTLQYQDQLYPRITFNAARIPTSGDILSAGTPTKEAQTGILFPPLCNGMSLAGVGVRIKYVFVKVYAVGTYVDPVAMMAIKKGSSADIEKALLDPTYPRTLRIVMNRGLSIDKYTAAIVESIEPRMKGQELETLEEFKKLNPPVDLVEGAEIEMTIRGDTLLYKNAVGGVGSLKSRLFCEALCDVYYGEDPVSPGHKESVMEGIKKL